MLIRSLIRLIGNSNVKKVALLQLLFLITAILQVAGVVSIAPFITMISNPETIKTNSMMFLLYSLYDFSSDVQFMISYAICVVCLLLLGNGISSYSLWRLFKTSLDLGLDIQRTIYNSYLNNDYTFFAMNNSSHLVAQVTNEVPRMVYMVIQPILTLVSQGFIALLIVIGLLIVDYKISILATIIVGSSYLLIFKLVRTKIVSNGKLLTVINKQKLKLLNESIGGIKELKLRGNEQYYSDKVDSVTQEGLSANAYISLAGDLPRFVVETVVFSAILCLSIYILITSGTAGEALSIISLYAMAGYKLLPAAQGMYKSYSQIKSNGSVVTKIDMEIENAKKHVSPLKNLGNDLAPNGVIAFEDITFSYPNASQDALKDCNLSIAENKVTALVGGSGAGKSTAIDILLGLMVPTKGAVTVAGIPLSKENIKDWRRRIGYVAQDIFLLDATVAENIALGVPSEEINYKKLEEAAKLANIYDFIMGCEGGFEFNLGERGAKLSGGQKQRIGIARALYKEPSILIFDEATSALDNVTEQLIMRDVMNLAKSKTVILIAHRLSSVEKADKIIVFKEGSVVAEGGYQELIETSNDFNALVMAGKAENNDS